MRIALLSLHTSPLAPLGGKKTGGMNVYVREISRFLGRNGVMVDVFTRDYAPETVGQIEQIDENARLIYLPAGPPEYLSTNDIYPHVATFRDALFDFVERTNACYDIVFSHYWLSGWVALELKDTWGIPVIQMFHTLGRMKDRIADEEMPEDDATIPLAVRNVRVAVEGDIMQRVDRLIAATPAERIQMLWLYRTDRRRIDVVSPGVDVEHFYPHDRVIAREQLGVAPDRKLLLFVGRIEPLKGIDTILEALRILRDEHPEDLDIMTLHIVGGDASEPEILRLRERCKVLGLDDVIAFVGARDHTALPTYYSAAEALIMPSDYESFGMVALEAMSSGTPVIASQVGGLAFLIQDDQTGVHVPVRDPNALAQAIHAILTDEAHRNTLGQQARSAAQAYSWPQIAERLLNIFNEILMTNRSSVLTNCD